ncbi:hypothetical protein PROFUN_05261 [Planoprotostelium fungivorum]|uniref:Peptidase S53 domain-containing protein n=1 Tax=Planoprotostelium fungivorum TaxID=1890364 RepID=A0A2P6NR90_9EUKA|nr:hypothetical protein PROFUN_05261 [Planoprotostelium fungivorum]
MSTDSVTTSMSVPELTPSIFCADASQFFAEKKYILNILGGHLIQFFWLVVKWCIENGSLLSRPLEYAQQKNYSKDRACAAILAVTMARAQPLLLLLLALIATALAGRRVTLENVHHVPEGWSATQKRDGGDAPLTLTIALKQRNMEKLDLILTQVSDPTSPQYGRYLTREQVIDLVAPTSDSILQVTQWLRSQGASPTDIHLHESKDFIDVTLSHSAAERMLETTFVSYIHTTGRRAVKAANSYSVPHEISSLIDFVSGFRLPNMKWRKSFEKMGMTHASPLLHPRARESLPNDNSPAVIYVNALDGIASATILPRCKDGQVTTNAQQLCGEDDNDADVTISGFHVTAVELRGEKKIEYDIPVTKAKCSPCENNSTACTQSNSRNNLPSGTVYCSVYLPGLTNYLPTYLLVTSQFSDDSQSVVGNASALSFSTSTFVTPKNLFELYNVPANLRVTNPASTQSVAEFLGQYYDPADLKKFFRLMGLPDTSDLVTVIGPNNVTNPGGEATLDIEYIMGLAVGSPTTFWSLPGLYQGQEPFLQWITDVLNSANPPLVHSISYGDDENTLSVEYVLRVNAEFKKAGVRGITLLFSSGDNGVFGGNLFTECTSFTPSFPASSPYVTAVGATLFSTETLPVCAENFAGFEFPCNDVGETTSSTSSGSRISSGGGYSIIFPRPSYQRAAVNNYNQYITDIPTSFYNTTGRVYPDISAIGHNFVVILDEEISPIDGTSASAPVIAGLITLLNDARLNAGKGPLGFLNPWLYGLSSDHFNDIVTGDNSCSELPWVCCDYGFPAKPGYDAVTGLGSPNFAALLKSALSHN